MAGTSIEPWISVDDTDRAVAFYTDAFGAREVERLEDEGTVLVACFAVGDARFWIQLDQSTAPVTTGSPSPVRLVLVVDDPDAMMSRAVASGAATITAVEDGHGWRIGRIVDPAGHHWEIGRRLPSPTG